MNVPWGTYGIHGTLFQETVSSAASHGCIRMFNRDVKELYSIVPVGTTVVIANGFLAPFGRKFDVVNPGDRGADVLAIQYRLNEWGYFKGRYTGIYEDDLKRAVHKFQKDRGLEVRNTGDKEDLLTMGFREFE